MNPVRRSLARRVSLTRQVRRAAGIGPGRPAVSEAAIGGVSWAVIGCAVLLFLLFLPGCATPSESETEAVRIPVEAGVSEVVPGQAPGKAQMQDLFLWENADDSPESAAGGAAESAAAADMGATASTETAPAGARGNERRNDYPIVLIYGFMGFGREALPGFYYWGGFTDLEKELSLAGFQAFTPEVGPISSNWDRACELYAFIKGGTVDYGEVHSRSAGHDRYGPTFPGVYPEWGETDPETGMPRKIHLIGHSMGGQTARVLVYLLENGAPEEGASGSERVSPLFTGRKKWVESVTTIATPHDGTTLLEDKRLFNSIQKATISVVAGLNQLDIFRFDFKLDHFGVSLRPGEDLLSYGERVYRYVEGSGITDIGTWDASVEGAAWLNSWVRAAEDVYYFSIANGNTRPEGTEGNYVPETDMSIVFHPAAWFMGSFTKTTGVTVDASWWENDGVVNTVSMKGPVNGSSDTIVRYSGAPIRGVWNYLGKLHSFDHGNTIGIPYFRMTKPGAFEGPLSWYLGLACFLSSLPPE